MNGKTLTSAELLAAAGITKRSADKIPLEHRHLLITAVLECIPEHKLRAVLVNNGVEASFRDVGTWMANTREWLGLPPIRRGKPSSEYVSEIEKWREANGNPTLDQIDGGWVPSARRKEEKELVVSKMSPKRRAEFREFQEMIASFKGVEDAEVQELLHKYLEKIKSKPQKTPAEDENIPITEPEPEGNGEET